jgi:SAM-dependent methyltransferase
MGASVRLDSAMDSIRVCPACLGENWRLVDTASVDTVADAWARQPHVRAVRDATRVGADVRADLGTDVVCFFRCGACGLETAEPMRAWSASHYPPETYGLAFDHLRALERLASAPPLRLLEIGCADGEFLTRVAALGHSVTGIDFDARAVAAARARGLDVQVGEVAALRSALDEKARFQAVAMFQLVEHLCDPDATFAQIGTVADDDCLLLIGCPSDRRYTRRLHHPDRLGTSDFWDWPPQHTLRWGASSLTAFLNRYGWRGLVVEAEPFSFVGAAAHVTALRAQSAAWAGRPLRRRAETLRVWAELALAQARRRMTGMRLLAVARRGTA